MLPIWVISKIYDLFDSLVKDIFIGAIIYGIHSFDKEGKINE